MKKFKPIKFPEDEAPHDNILEWWYFNGHLKDAAGKKYAFMDCLFKTNPSKSTLPFAEYLVYKKDIYFAHHIVSDIAKQKSYPVIKLLCATTDESFKDGRLNVHYFSPYPGSFVSEINELEPYHFHIKNENMDLHLKARKAPLLEGGKGFLKLNNETTYYYSLTDLKTEGFIIIDGKKIKVTGKSWFDHQWSDPVHPEVTWDWFSVQLRNKADLVCLCCKEGNQSTRLASLMLPNGKTMHTDKVEFIDLKDYWTSPQTQATYPLSWQIKIPEFKIDLKTKPLIQGQEMLFGFINYWEGPLSISGSFNDKRVSGQGFMELLGYPFEVSRLKLIEEEILEMIKKNH